jgi:hypothetical protein
MMHTSLAVITAWANAGLLVLAGSANLSSFRAIRAVYADWDIPEIFYRAVGMLQILAAVFLISPDMRIYGSLIAAPILFGSVVLLLNHRHYAVAAPVMAMMASVVLVAALSIAPVHSHFVVENTAQLGEPAAHQETLAADTHS